MDTPKLESTDFDEFQPLSPSEFEYPILAPSLRRDTSVSAAAKYRPATPAELGELTVDDLKLPTDSDDFFTVDDLLAAPAAAPAGKKKKRVGMEYAEAVEMLNAKKPKSGTDLADLEVGTRINIVEVAIRTKTKTTHAGTVRDLGPSMNHEKVILLDTEKVHTVANFKNSTVYTSPGGDIVQPGPLTTAFSYPSGKITKRTFMYPIHISERMYVCAALANALVYRTDGVVNFGKNKETTDVKKTLKNVCFFTLVPILYTDIVLDPEPLKSEGANDDAALLAEMNSIKSNTNKMYMATNIKEVYEARAKGRAVEGGGIGYVAADGTIAAIEESDIAVCMNIERVRDVLQPYL